MSIKVHGEGNYDSKIWLIGEAPGQQEERLGRPFIGGAGRILDGMLQESGIKRGECYIDNIIQERPPKNDFGVYYRDKGRKNPTDYLLRRHSEVKELVKTYRPNVVVALGNEALYALTGKMHITKWRGSILWLDGIKVIPTIHPAMIMRQYEFRPTSIFDFNKIKKESATPKFPDSYRDNFIINPTYKQVMDTLGFLAGEKFVAFDIETAQNQIVCIGFGWSKQDSICIPIFFGGSSWWPIEEELAIVRGVRELLANPNVGFIAQNAQFDMVYLADKWGVEVTNLWMDTMIAMHCVYPELRKGLDFLCSIFTTRPYYKDMPHEHGGPDKLWHYNCLDTVVTYECAMEIRKELYEFKTFDFYMQHSHRLIKPLIKMQRRGIRIDLKKREKIDASLSIEADSMQQRLTDAVGHELNPNSPKQMKEFLYDELKLPPQRNRKTGNLAADVDALEALAKRFPNPVFNLILDIRKVKKILKQYGLLYVAGKGRHPKFLDSETGISYPIKSHGKKTMILSYALEDLIKKFDLPADIFDRR